jgi:hypothetical protein
VVLCTLVLSFLLVSGAEAYAACNRACKRCPATVQILQNDIGMPTVLALLIVKNLQHYKKMHLRSVILVEPHIYSRSILFWENSIGPTISSIKKALRVNPGDSLELSCPCIGGNYYPVVKDSLRLDAEKTWYYKIIPPTISLRIGMR